jgi:RNA polymerase sigma factor (sigma-70 family)
MPLSSDVLSAAQGDRDAFHRLVSGHRNVVTSIALATVGDVASSEDVAQEVFLHAWRGLRKLRNPESFLPWLRQLTRNRSQEALRERYRRAKGVDAVASLPESDGGPNPQSALIAQQDERELATAIDALPDDTREVVLLFYREGKSVAHVARLLDLSEDAVKKRLSRAREKLREAVLENIGRTSEKSAPSDAFCLGIMAAIPTAMPGASTAVSVGALKTALGSAFGGAAMGIAGILVGTKLHLSHAVDDTERRDVRRLASFAVGVVLVGTVGVVLGEWQRSLPLALGSGFFSWAGVFGLYGLWMPRILRRHFSLLSDEDPEKVRLAKRRTWFRFALGLGLGATCGLAGLLFGLVAALRAG